MKPYSYLAIVLLALTLSVTSCREKSEKEKLIDEMKEDGATIKEKSDDGDYKLKMETDDKEVKIKEDADGETKIKVDN
ncbi:MULTISPECIES: hypothetical protein [unclassified Leeuwenhoekiella]|uniref:hypothetical protein n=1 Tax=unclassified Leeuwenhoekiella TaxID=2615029 RepID=UPI000C42364F|nr:MULTISPECIES: hypothetical protein [unclassified Leeuwenhoekiella]MBA82569.1 hypothetical protein [Leeuwenhoekiella sp.]|tara:strand:- start:51709 stop:51942 length:234 start_codon:yes stop_codon:yes gene_type:complete